MIGKLDKNIETDMKRILKSGIFEWISLEARATSEPVVRSIALYKMVHLSRVIFLSCSSMLASRALICSMVRVREVE